MNVERKIIREISKILMVEEDDIPKTLIRFKKDIRRIEKELGY